MNELNYQSGGGGIPARSQRGGGYPKVPTPPPSKLRTPPGQVPMGEGPNQVPTSGGGVPQGTYPPNQVPTGEGGGTPRYLPTPRPGPNGRRGYPKVPTTWPGHSEISAGTLFALVSIVEDY